MIEMKNYVSCMQKLSILLQAEIKENWLNAMKEELDKYFDDKTFQQACSRLVAETETYGKLPTVHQFLQFSPVRGVDKKVEKKQEFLNKVASFLELDYVLDYDRRKFDDLSELEYKTLQSLGGLSELYARVHNIDYPTNIATIIRQLSEFYDNNYNAESSKLASERKLFIQRGASIPDELTDNWSNGITGVLLDLSKIAG